MNDPVPELRVAVPVRGRVAVHRLDLRADEHALPLGRKRVHVRHERQLLDQMPVALLCAPLLRDVDDDAPVALVAVARDREVGDEVRVSLPVAIDVDRLLIERLARGENVLEERRCVRGDLGRELRKCAA